MQTLVISFTDKETGIRETLRVEKDSARELHNSLIEAIKNDLYKKDVKEITSSIEGSSQNMNITSEKVATLVLEQLKNNKVLAHSPLEGSIVGIESKKVSRHRIPKVKLISCNGCGDIAIGKFDEGDLFECRTCNSTQNIVEGFEFAEYLCACCGTKAYLAVTADTYEYVKCRACHAPIDMVWNHRDKKYISMNLIGNQAD